MTMFVSDGLLLPAFCVLSVRMVLSVFDVEPADGVGS
jgi:hypothetical protein